MPFLSPLPPQHAVVEDALGVKKGDGNTKKNKKVPFTIGREDRRRERKREKNKKKKRKRKKSVLKGRIKKEKCRLHMICKWETHLT